MSDDPRPPRPGGTPGGAEPAGGAPGAGDPSMEDILASIRRILNEDEAAPASADPSPAGEASPNAEGDEPLELSEDMLVPDATGPAGAPPAPPEPYIPPAPPPPPAAPAMPAPVMHTPVAAMTPASAEAGLIGAAPAAAAAASVGSLLRAVAAERNAVVHRGGPTIEDVVREEVRPLLKEWLDTNLPPLVERLVRAEIERVVGRSMT